jgi:hypothetical protein
LPAGSGATHPELQNNKKDTAQVIRNAFVMDFHLRLTGYPGFGGRNHFGIPQVNRRNNESMEGGLAAAGLPRPNRIQKKADGPGSR